MERNEPSWHRYSVKLVDANWVISAPGVSDVLIPVDAGVTFQTLPLGILPANAHVLAIRMVVDAGPPTGNITKVFLDVVGVSGVPNYYISGPVAFDITTPSPTNFKDATLTNIGNNTLEPTALTGDVNSQGGTLGRIVPPCAFSYDVLWGVTGRR